MQRYTIRHFERDFPDDDACLEYVKNLRWPDGITCTVCQKVTPHHKITRRRAYACQWCGSHVYPMAGTIIEHSSTPLRLWFHALFLMGSTRCGISAKQLERELGVTYKCAWRIFKQIRSMLDDDVMTLLGQVEIDESYFGGKSRGKSGRPGRDSNKTPVLGMVERGGKIVARVVPDVKVKTLLPIIAEKVLPRAIVYTDENLSYRRLGKMGYQHRRIHHQQGVYVMGDITTNTVESFWSLCKNGLRGVNRVVSAKYLQGYVNAYAFRWNRRNDDEPMFLQMLSRLAHPLRGGEQPSLGPQSPVS